MTQRGPQDVPHEGESPRDQQSESVGTPYRGDDAPKRTGQPAVWMVLAAVLVVALVVALVIAAVRSS